MFNYEMFSLPVLWIHYETYGDHDAAVEICDRALNGDKEAETYAERIWSK